MRARNFSGVFYPDSMPPDAFERIKAFGCKCAVSPLHQPDEDNKKPHYHIVFSFGGSKSIEQIRKMMYSLGSGLVQVCNDLGACIRYLIHFDNPEKEQFDKSQILCFNIDIDKYFKTNSDKMNYMRKIFSIINENKLRNYNEVISMCSSDNELLELCLKYSYAINLYLRSC